MRIVVAPDKFKGSLEATDVVEHLAAGIRSVDPSATVVAVPVDSCTVRVAVTVPAASAALPDSETSPPATLPIVPPAASRPQP